MILRRASEPANEPVTVDELKAHLRVDGDAEHDYLSLLIMAARQYVETTLRRSLMPCTWELITDAQDAITLSMPPIVSVESATDENNAAVSHTLTMAGDVKLTGVSGLVKIAYTAGMSLESDEAHTQRDKVPALYRHAIKLIAGHLYENREDVIVGAGITASQLPSGVDRLLSANRNVRF